MPRAIGAAGDGIAGASAGGERRRTAVRRSRVALSVAIAADIEPRCGLCEREGCSAGATACSGHPKSGPALGCRTAEGTVMQSIIRAGVLALLMLPGCRVSEEGGKRVEPQVA